ncbi:hypothetical protein GJAV_G00000680 [Gymnothorax javanicus]|nr:hypothetical protein GJAV_G00000680 [Gymnothorax javanicus]
MSRLTAVDAKSGGEKALALLWCQARAVHLQGCGEGTRGASDWKLAVVKQRRQGERRSEGADCQIPVPGQAILSERTRILSQFTDRRVEKAQDYQEKEEFLKRRFLGEEE